jgi:HK97 gp10 family phage protein
MVAAIEVKGMKELNKSLTKIGFDFQELKDANFAIGKIVADRAANLAPKKTGKLANSIKAQPDKLKVKVSAGGANVPYAGVIEYGWKKRNIRPQPYIRKAADQLKEQIIEKYKSNINQIIKKYNLN